MRNPEVAHLWMSGNTPAGSGSNFSFSGGSLFSYYTMIAARRVNKDGVVVVFIDNTIYSRTTSSKHMPHVVRATNHYLRVFYSVEECQQDEDIKHLPLLPNEVTDVVINHYMRKQIDELVTRATRARTRADELLTDAIDLAETLNNVLDWYGSSLERFDATEFKRHLGTKMEELKQQQLERERKAQEKDALDFQAWLEGTSNKVPSSFKNGKTAYLRISPVDKKTVETSLDANFPVKSCELLYRLWKKGEYISDKDLQISIGNYNLNWLDPAKGIKAGCHFVSAEEIERFAAVIGLKG